jgi:ribonucleoside-triphosphate reductase
MYFKVSYDQDFDDLMMYLRGKYPKELFDLEGIGEQTDLSKFSKKFFSSTVTADASIDANANVEDTGVIVYNTELPKPFFKVNSYYILWKELKKAHGLGIANKIVEQQLSGDIYIHDFHGIGAGLPYCFNYSTYDIMTKGLPMVKKIKSSPPKYLYSFKSQLEQFTVIASNSTLGATGLADMLVVMSYYVKQKLETSSLQMQRCNSDSSRRKLVLSSSKL